VGGGGLFTGVFNGLLENGYSDTNTWLYKVNLYWLLPIVFVAFLCTWFVRTKDRDRLGWPELGESGERVVGRMRLWRRLVIVDSKWNVRVLDKEAEERLYEQQHKIEY